MRNSINVSKINYTLAAVGRFVVTCQRNPEGVKGAIGLGLVAVLGLAAWHMPLLLDILKTAMSNAQAI